MKTIARKIAVLYLLLTPVYYSWTLSAQDHAETSETVDDSFTQDSLNFCQADWIISKVGNRAIVKHGFVNIFNSSQYISIIEYNSRRFSSSIVQLPDAGKEITSTLAKDRKAKFAVNAGYFNVKTNNPTTYVRTGKKTYARTLPSEVYRVNGVVGFKDRKGHHMKIEICDSTQYDSLTADWFSVLATGPVLIKEGAVISYDNPKTFYTKRHPRTFVGLDDNRIVMVVIDGRRPQAEGMTINETGKIAYLLNLTDAINLDGGGSSTIWTRKEGVINHPYDNRKFDHEGERKVPNFIIAK